MFRLSGWKSFGSVPDQPKDLVNSDVDEIEMDCFRWAKFYKTYGNDCTVIAMKFPCETGQQQAYWKKRLRENGNPEYAPMLIAEDRRVGMAGKEHLYPGIFPDVFL